MPRKSVKIQTKIDTTDEKRNLIDSLELLRGNKTSGKISADSATKNAAGTQETYPEAKNMQQEIRRLQSANILLESDLKDMEHKALTAIAESGKMRRQLDLIRDNSSANQNHYYEEERQALLAELRHSRYTHNMLTEAINESQNEITRLTRTIEKLTLKLLAA